MNSDAFVRTYGPILDFLREFGGAAHRQDIKSGVAAIVEPDAATREATYTNGQNKVESEVGFSMSYLRHAGLIEPTGKGFWRLTQNGQSTSLPIEAAREVQANVVALLKHQKSATASDFATDSAAGSASSLLQTIVALPPAGFERLCNRILVESGFTEVVTKGEPNDGGIDVEGLMRLNELIAFKVLVQCKRYQSSVGPGIVRDCRGAMQGRTDKGIIMTTGYFTASARQEAVRPGTPPIELIDGDALVSLMERLVIGVKPRTVYDVDEAFFEPFRRG